MIIIKYIAFAWRYS